jgi:hypothetical protein
VARHKNMASDLEDGEISEAPPPKAGVVSEQVRHLVLTEALGADDGADESESDDSDFEGGKESSSESSSDKHMSDADNEDDEGKAAKRQARAAEKAKIKKKKRKAGGAEGKAAKKDGPASPRKRAKKDPNAPKKPLSSFMFFSAAMRPKISVQYPDLKLGELAKKISELWRNTTTHEKAPYEEQVAADKARYAEEMKTYEPSPEFLAEAAEFPARSPKAKARANTQRRRQQRKQQQGSRLAEDVTMHWTTNGKFAYHYKPATATVPGGSAWTVPFLKGGRGAEMNRVAQGAANRGFDRGFLAAAAASEEAVAAAALASARRERALFAGEKRELQLKLQREIVRARDAGADAAASRAAAAEECAEHKAAAALLEEDLAALRAAREAADGVARREAARRANLSLPMLLLLLLVRIASWVRTPARLARSVIAAAAAVLGPTVAPAGPVLTADGRRAQKGGSAASYAHFTQETQLRLRDALLAYPILRATSLQHPLEVMNLNLLPSSEALLGIKSCEAQPGMGPQPHTGKRRYVSWRFTCRGAELQAGGCATNYRLLAVWTFLDRVPWKVAVSQHARILGPLSCNFVRHKAEKGSADERKRYASVDLWTFRIVASQDATGAQDEFDAAPNGRNDDAHRCRLCQ